MNDILIPRRLEGRKERYKRIIYQKIQQYIKNGSKGDLNLSGATIEYLPDNLTIVNGDLIMDHSKIVSLNNLHTVTDHLSLWCTPIQSLGNLKVVGGTISLDGSLVEHLDNLRFVGEDLWIRDTPLEKYITKDEINEMIMVKGKIETNDFFEIYQKMLTRY